MNHLKEAIKLLALSGDDYPKTSKQVAQWFAQNGYPGYTVHRHGAGYFQIIEDGTVPTEELVLGDPMDFPGGESIYTYALRQMTLDKWLEHFLSNAEG